MAEENKSTSEVDDWLEDIEESDDFSGELDQDNIDALLSAGPDETGDSASEYRDWLPAMAPSA